MAMPVRYEDPLPHDQYLVRPHKNFGQVAEDALDREIRDVVGPDVKVTKETTAVGMIVDGPRRVLFWEVVEPSEEHLAQLEKLKGVRCLQKDGIEENVTMALPGKVKPGTPLPYDQYLVYPYETLDEDAENALDRKIRDLVGPDIKVTRETYQTAVKGVRRVLFWEVVEPSEDHLIQLEKLEGVDGVQKDGFDGGVSYG
ncbi:hypothetical protein LTR95_006254 [Oleoguttula sp. CCFEE 5521]